MSPLQNTRYYTFFCLIFNASVGKKITEISYIYNFNIPKGNHDEKCLQVKGSMMSPCTSSKEILAGGYQRLL